MKLIIILTVSVCVLMGCSTPNKSSFRQTTYKSINSMDDMACKLTTPELQERKQKVLGNIRAKIIDKKEIDDGYAFRFPGSDEMVAELSEFIVTERACCPFFTFALSVSGDKSDIWLELSGPDGAKDFIASELEF